MCVHRLQQPHFADSNCPSLFLIRSSLARSFLVRYCPSPISGSCNGEGQSRAHVAVQTALPQRGIAGTQIGSRDHPMLNRLEQLQLFLRFRLQQPQLQLFLPFRLQQPERNHNSRCGGRALKITLLKL